MNREREREKNRGRRSSSNRESLQNWGSESIFHSLPHCDRTSETAAEHFNQVDRPDHVDTLISRWTLIFFPILTESMGGLVRMDAILR